MEVLNVESYSWYMLFTALYTEQRVKSKLDELGIANFLPLITSKLLWGDKEINKDVPAISRCIFVRLSIFEVEKLSDIPSLLLPANLSDWQVPEQQIENMNLALIQGDLSKVWSLIHPGKITYVD